MIPEINFATNKLRGLKEVTVGEYRDSLTSENKALKFSQKVKDNVGEAETLEYLGIAYNSLNQVGKSLIYYDRALIIYQQQNDDKSQHEILSTLRLLCRKNNLWQMDIDYSQQILSLIERLNYTPSQIPTVKAYKADILNDIGVSYGNLQKYQQEIEFCQQALDIYWAIKDSQEKALYLSNIGLANFHLGTIGVKDSQKISQAIDYYQKSLQIYQKNNNKQKEIELLVKLGNAYASYPKDALKGDLKGDFTEQVNSCYQQALQICKQCKEWHQTIAILNIIGNNYFRLEEYFQAIEYHQQALTISRDSNNLPEQAHTSKHIGFVYNQLGQNSEAIQYYQQALQIYLQLEDSYQISNIKMLLNTAYENLN